ncbi:MAG: dTDP-4-dehydrorhamnose 3,5-epimerase family protein [Candidatus Limnocylindrales bacterium]
MTTIPGIRSGRTARHQDDRGVFRELWRSSAFGALDPAETGPTADVAAGRAPRFVQANLSSSAPGVLRGLHCHRHQLDYWVVTGGRAFVALVDVRDVLRGRAEPEVDTRELGPDEWVVIPAGVAHGFLALEPLELLYLVTDEYDGSDELGFSWDDPTAAVPWPTDLPTPDGRPILSDRDRSNPTLAELVATLRG